MTKQKKYGIALVLILFVISLLKDVITPDYLNTPAASFLNPSKPNYTNALASHITYPSFWIVSYIYSVLFILIPTGIIRCLVDKSLSTITCYILTALCIIIYLLVFSENSIAIVNIVPKLNRYFHSPLITLFLLASFTLYKQHDNKVN